MFTHHSLPPAFFAALQEMGVPKNVTSLTIRIAVDEPVSIECSFYPDASADQLNEAGDALTIATRRYQLVELEDGVEA